MQPLTAPASRELRWTRWPLAAFGVAVLGTAVWQLLLSGARWTTPATAPLLQAVALYLCSHLLRAARVGLLLLFERPATSKLFAVHFGSALLSAAVPFKLGELARAFGLVLLARQPGTGLAAYLMEKLLDALVLLAAIAFLAATGDVSPAPGVLAAVLLAAVLAGVAAYLSARTTLRELRTLLVAGSHSARSLAVLGALRMAEAAHTALRGMLRGRFLALVVLTVLVWALDVAAFTRIATASGSAVSLPGDFLRTLQSMLQPASGAGAAGYYAAMVATCLSITALPAGAVLLRLAWRAGRTPVAVRMRGRHKRYVDGGA